MPWSIKEREGRYCVVKDDSEETVACHDTQEEARKHQSALYANEPASKADLSSDETLVYVGESVKTLGDGKIGGVLVPFGDPGTTDAHGDYFTSSTDFGLDISTRARVIYHHGFTKAFGRRRLGVVGMGLEPAAGVVAVEPVQLDLDDPPQRDIYAKAERGEMFWSTGTAPHLMARRPSGPKAREILSWPITECSLTPTPANRNARAMALKALIDGDEAEGDPLTLQAITSDGDGAAPAPGSFDDFLLRLATDAERARAQAAHFAELRRAEGRDLSQRRLESIKAVEDAFGALHREYSGAVAAADADAIRSGRITALGRDLDLIGIYLAVCNK